MARVQSVLTYTVAAGDSACPPKAPLRCGCDNLLLILEDRSLLKTALRGILSVEIKSVAVSEEPVSYIDSYGNNSLVWKFDYTIEYQDTDLTDPAYRVRKCDIAYNCCHSCGQVYTDRKLEGYVKSVTGAIVNNADPQNPVLTVPPAVSDSLVPTGGRGLRHTAVDGTITNFHDGISSIVSAQDCVQGGFGPTYALRNFSFFPDNVLHLESAPEHFTPATSGGGVSGSYPQPAGLTVPTGTDWTSLAYTFVLGNPSACRSSHIAIFVEGIMEFETPGIPFKYNWGLQVQFNNGGFNDLQARNSYSYVNDPGLGNRDENSTFRTFVLTLTPSQSLTVDIRLRFRPVGSDGKVHTYTLGMSALGGTA